jgi:hypothetical protein
VKQGTILRCSYTSVVKTGIYGPGYNNNNNNNNTFIWLQGIHIKQIVINIVIL